MSDRAAQDRLERMLNQAGGFFREGTALVATCPRCRKQKLHFRIATPDDPKIKNRFPFRFECFSGGCSRDRFSGRPEFALAEMLGIRPGAARRELLGQGDPFTAAATFSDLDLDFEKEDELPLQIEALPPLEWPGSYFPIDHPRSARGAAYMEGRGVPIEIAKQYGVRYSVEERSVIFPIEDRGRLVGWQSRLVVSHFWVDDEGIRHEGVKARTSKGFQRHHWMFGDRLLESPHAFVLEGPFDAIKAHLCGGNAAATGKKITPALLAALSAYPWRDLYCGLDRGTAPETERLVGEFDQVVKHPGRRCWLVEWPQKRCEPCGGGTCERCKGTGLIDLDSGALKFEEVYELWRAAKPVSSRTFFFDLAS